MLGAGGGLMLRYHWGITRAVPRVLQHFSSLHPRWDGNDLANRPHRIGHCRLALSSQVHTGFLKRRSACHQSSKGIQPKDNSVPQASRPSAQWQSSFRKRALNIKVCSYLFLLHTGFEVPVMSQETLPLIKNCLKTLSCPPTGNL
jgi:hypothetical protein